ncbi:DNA double-strand break repair Rad50 ATPase [hydrothermal vent metagenome]|uniref:DNA double-strand break repair Rad50 ATPase n=1 Tax=hydrothermal vent metagenome TaxID=652676 RepID=A0A3B1E636_9ZZZZ
MNNNQSIFNTTIVEMILILVFLIAILVIYSLSIKTIDVDSTTKGLQYINKKINDNLGVSKKISKNKRENELNIKKRYLENKLSKLKDHRIVKNTLKELNQQNNPIQEQIDNLRKLLEKRYDRQLNLKQNILKLKSDPEVRYVLLTLNKYNIPIKKQINSVENEIKKIKYYHNLKNKNNNYTIKHVLDNPEHKPVKWQIDNSKDSKYSQNIKNALDELINKNNKNKLRNSHKFKYSPKTKKLLNKLGLAHKPIKQQIGSLKNKLKDSKYSQNIKNALDELINKNNKVGKPEYNASTNQLLNELNISNKPLERQQELLNKELDNFSDTTNNPKNTKQALEALKQIDTVEIPKNYYNNYMQKLQNTLIKLQNIQKDKDLLSNKPYRPIINKDIEKAIKYLEKNNEIPSAEDDKSINNLLNQLNIINKPIAQQLRHLYDNLYSKPENNFNIGKVKFTINQLNAKKELKDKINNISKELLPIQKVNTPVMPKIKVTTDDEANTSSKADIQDTATNKLITDETDKLNRQIKYLKKLIKNSSSTHLPCVLTNEGSTIYLFTLFLREKNIYIKRGWKDNESFIAKDIPNLSKLLNKKMSLAKFMRLTRPIFNKSVKNDCRYFVYFKDRTNTKREYKRKTLTIQHHFYKYIRHTW